MRSLKRWYDDLKFPGILFNVDSYVVQVVSYPGPWCQWVDKQVSEWVGKYPE
jgi:hypothetical protein